MLKKQKKKQPRVLSPAPVLEPNAAGIDIGATEIYIAVPADRDVKPVRRFATFTEDLVAAADWLQRCGSKRRRWNRPGCTGFRYFRY
jgi:transposase